MKRIVKEQKNRKRLWWLLFLLFPLYVVLDGTFQLADTDVYLETKVKKKMMEMEDVRIPDLERESVPAEEVEEDEGIIDKKYWLFIDRLIERLKELWPLLGSILLFLTRKRLIGDDKS